MRDQLEALARQAARQHGLLSTRQIAADFRTDSAPARLLRRGIVQRRSRGVYALVGAATSWESDLLEVCLATDRLVVASHRSASRLWGMRSVDDDIELSVRYPASLSRTRATVHRSRDLTQFDFTFIDAVPVTTPARTLCDLGLVLPEGEVERLAHHCIAKGIVGVGELWRYRRRVGRRGRTGVGALERALDALPPDVASADSGPEVALAGICRRFSLPEPAWQHPVAAGGRRYVLDFAYPEQRIAIEYDEYVDHSRPEKFESDRRRQNDLQAAGWTVIRFVWSDVRDHPSRVAQVIRSFLVL